MSCVSLNICRVKSANIHVSGDDRLSISASLAGLDINVNKQKSTTFNISRKHELLFHATPICTFSNGAMMVVYPNIVWLNEDNDFSANFDVISNVDWNIE